MIPDELKIPTDIRILQSINAISQENVESQRRQNRKNTFLVLGTIIIGVISLVFAYLTLKATLSANAASQAATDAKNKQLQLETKISQLEAKLSEYQSKNLAMSASLEEMRSILKMHGLDDR